MKNFAYLVVVTMFFGMGCTGTVQEIITCYPPQADIYWGKTESQLKKTGYKTPYSRTFSGSNLEPWCYQVKKEKYRDSEIICRDEEGFRYLDFQLVHLKPPKTTAPPHKTKPVDKQLDSTNLKKDTETSERNSNTHKTTAKSVRSVQPSKSFQQTKNVERIANSYEEDRPSYPYSISLGSYKTPRRVERALSIYIKRGLSPYWVKVDLGSKGVWFRVFAGYFQKREDAEAFIAKNNLVNVKSRHTKYANLIGVYKSKKELETKRNLLSELGYCPYVIREKNE
jgi:hypothetical protein